MATSNYYPGAIVETPKGKVRVLERKPGKRTANGKVHPRVVIKILKTGTVLDVQQGNIPLGKFKDYREPTVYGIGYLGSNIQIPDRGQPNILRRIYDLWANMLKRAYGGYKSCYSYSDVRVDPRWHNFTNFLNTIVKVPGYHRWEKNEETMSLDKDSKFPDKRLYSLDTCVFVSIGENTRESSKRRWRGRSVPA